MKTVGTSVTIPKSRLGKQISVNDNAAANEQEVEEQIEEDNVERAADENGTCVPVLIVRRNAEIETAHDAVAAGEEVEEQAEESRIDKVAFEDGISAASAEEYIKARAH